MDIKKLISEMTLEEKASLCSGRDFWHTKAIERLGIPSMMVSDGPHGLRKQNESADHLGIKKSIEAVCFPTACATAASFDRDLIRRVGEELGDECQHEGLAVLLGPAVNIKRSPLCGRNFEYISEDPYLAADMSAAFIHGVQSRGVGTSIKHFAANSQEHRRASSSSNVDERTLREIYLPAFEKSVKEEKPWTVMCAYNRLNGVYASENKWLLKDLLRGEWGFDGFVMSDWGAVADRATGIDAGLDLEMPGSAGINDAKIVAAVKAGTLDESALDLCVENILRIIDRVVTNAKPETPWDKEAHHALAADFETECAVLLKNENSILPLSKADEVAFIGEFAAKPRFQGGGSSHINCFKVTSALDAAQGLKVTYAQGYSAAEDTATDAQIAEAVAAARKAKAAVVFAGLPDLYESEGYDRQHMRMPACQNRLIEAVAAVNPNTVVVLHNGSPVEMPWIGSVAAVLEVYLGGQAVGEATVRLLFGDAVPSGHLAETFPLKVEDNPAYLYYTGEGNDTDYNEGIFVGYRYYDKKKMDVLFPFGYGLSYTTFEYTDLRLSSEHIADTDALTAAVTVKNTGSRTGKTVVQLYVRNENGDLIRPVRELKGFEKVELAPGETKEVTFTLNRRSFAYWNTKIHDWHVLTGEYIIEIGQSSRDICLTAAVKVDSTVKLPRHYDRNSVFMDILDDPEAARKARKLLDLIDPRQQNDPASEGAVSNEMFDAMFRCMPLRELISFYNTVITNEMIDGLVDELNAE